MTTATKDRGVQPIYTEHSPLEPVLRMLGRIAPSEATVLLTGATGTGKEVMARLVHEHSRRENKAIVAVNCGAIPEGLLETELFGHVRGAFTGAAINRKGRIAHAEGGTLFLDEVGELPPALQVKLLRVLQEHRYEPVGSAESVEADFRLVAATNKDLLAEVEAGRFRRDLYYRLLVCPVEIPPLCERSVDVPALLTHFWHKQGEVRVIMPSVVAKLCHFSWPGNVRELENLAQRLSVVSCGEIITVQDLPEPYRSAQVPAGERLPQAIGPDSHYEVPVLHSTPAAQAAAAPLSLVPANHGFSAGDQRGYAGRNNHTLGPGEAASPASRPDWNDVRGTEDPAPPAIDSASTPAAALPAPGALPGDLPSYLRELESRCIDLALEQTGGNRKAAAELLGLRRTTLVEKLKRRERPAA